jgi:endo-1,4-beta-mannosidase
LLELEAFSKVLRLIDVANCRRPDVDAALVVPSYIDAQYPFTTHEDKTAPIASLRQAYVAAHEADLPVAFARETDGLPEDVALLIVPSMKQLTSPTWRWLADRARAGATVYVSYFAGVIDVQRGPWYGELSALFGVQHQLRYGLADPIEDDQVSFTFVEAFGNLLAGTVLTFRVGGSRDARTFLPVVADGAITLALDDRGRPALLAHQLGAGQVILCTYPLEYMAASLPAVNPEPTYRLYDALAVAAGIKRDVIVDDPRVLVGALDHEDGRRFIWLASQDAAPLMVKPQFSQPAQLVNLDGSAVPEQLELPPYGVLVVELEVAD